MTNAIQEFEKALKKYNAISEYYVFPYRQNLERIFANEKGGGIKNKIISSQLQRELRQIVSEKELPLSFISLERVINETEYSEDYEVISTIAKLEKLKPRSVEFIKFKKKHIRQILEKNTFLNELTLIEEKEGTEFFICVSLLLDSIKRKESSNNKIQKIWETFDEEFLKQYKKEWEEIDSLEYKKLQAARENAITEINNLLTPEEQEIVYSHQIQINIPYLEILPTYCGCEILPPSLQLPFFGRQKYKYNPEQRDKYFVANGHYPEYEQIHYHHIENCLKTLEQINEFKNQVIAAIQKERPIFSEIIKSIIISREREKAEKKEWEEIKKKRELLAQQKKEARLLRWRNQDRIGKITIILVIIIMGVTIIEKFFRKKKKNIKQSSKNNY